MCISKTRTKDDLYSNSRVQPNINYIQDKHKHKNYRMSSHVWVQQTFDNNKIMQCTWLSLLSYTHYTKEEKSMLNKTDNLINIMVCEVWVGIVAKRHWASNNLKPPEFYFISVQVMQSTDSPYSPVNINITANQYAISTCPLSS